jgi:hypothetical protein
MDVKVLQWCKRKGHPTYLSTAFETIAKGNRIDKLNEMLDAGLMIADYSLKALFRPTVNVDAAFLLCLKRRKQKFDPVSLWEVICPPAERYSESYPLTSHQMDLMVDLGYKMEAEDAWIALWNCRLDVLTWLYDRGCPIDHKEILTYKLRKPWNTKYHYAAVRKWVQDHPPKKIATPTAVVAPRPPPPSRCRRAFTPKQIAGYFFVFLITWATCSLILRWFAVEF